MVAVNSLRSNTLLLQLFTLVIVLYLPSCSNAEEEGNQNMTVDPTHIKQAQGRIASFQCNTKYELSIRWIDPNGTEIQQLNNSRLKDDGDGGLRIEPVMLYDHGEYLCMTLDGALNHTVSLETYIMPDYQREGMIILILNGILVVMFFGCLIFDQSKKRKQKKKFKATVEKNAKDRHINT